MQSEYWSDRNGSKRYIGVDIMDVHKRVGKLIVLYRDKDEGEQYIKVDIMNAQKSGGEATALYRDKGGCER